MNKNIDLIRQALGAAESSIKLAKQLLMELEKGGKESSPNKELPGVLGTFDGESMVTAEGQKFPVPENYASKSLLVVGDTLKLVDENGQKRFKQIEHMKRHKTNGILAKKDGKWKAVTPEGSYKVLPVSVEHFDGKVGDEVLLQLPANNLTSPYGAIEKIIKKEEAKPETDDSSQTEVKANPPAPIRLEPSGEEKAPAVEAKKEKKKEEPKVEPKIEDRPQSASQARLDSPRQIKPEPKEPKAIPPVPKPEPLPAPKPETPKVEEKKPEEKLPTPEPVKTEPEVEKEKSLEKPFEIKMPEESEDELR